MNSQAQQATVLITTLMMLFVMSLLVVSGMKRNGLQIKMAAFFREKAVAMNAAESALMDKEDALSDEMAFVSPPVSGVHIQSNLRLLNVDACGRSHYLIQITAQYRQAVDRIDSEYQLSSSIQKSGCVGNANQQLWWKVY